MKKLLSMIVSLLTHLIAVLGLTFFVKSFADWFLNKIPALGVDLYNSVTNVSILQKHFSFWFNGFKDISFAGNPLFMDFPRFQYYLMLPFANLFGTLKGVQVYVIFSLLLIVLSSYVLFYRVSKNAGVSFFLATLVFLSVNIYGSATWGGSLPYFGTQFFLPLTLALIVTFFDSTSYRYLAGASLMAGLAFLSHPLPSVAFVIPISVILLMTYPMKDKAWRLRSRIADLFKFTIGVIATGYIYFYNSIFSLITSFFTTIFSAIGNVSKSTRTIGVGESVGFGGMTSTADQISQFYKSQIINLIKDTNQLILFLLVAGLILVILVTILKKNKKSYLRPLSFFFALAYITGHVYLNFSGASFLPQGLYRAFWTFPIIFAALAASLWSSLTLIKNKYLQIFNLFSILFFLPLVYFIFRLELPSVINKINNTSEVSSAYPEVLSLKTNKIQQEELKKQLTPSFMDPNNKNQRLYASDATVNIWWNSLFDMPTARGYVDPPIGASRRGGFFMLDISIGNDSLVNDFKFTPDMAEKNALFLIDWYGIYYFEGGHLSPSANAGPSSYLINNGIFANKEEVVTNGAILRNETVSGRPEARFDLTQTLIYYQIKDDYVSPIVYATNAPRIMVFANYDGFEQIWRLLAANNLNSRYVIPVWGNNNIDDYSQEELSNFDAIIAYNYSYKNRNNAMKILANYTKNGGKLFIDTGGDSKDSQLTNLGQPFPFNSSTQTQTGKVWQFQANDDVINKEIDFNKFGQSVFNDGPWKYSSPTTEDSLIKGAKVILRNYGKAVIIKSGFGKGEVIWSGLNFPYHFNQYTNAEEANYFKNILSEMVDLKSNEIISVLPVWEKPEKIKIAINNPARGLIIKEQLYDVWKANLFGQEAKNLKIYPAGPTYPGFMYIPLPKLSGNSNNIEVSYTGETRFWTQSIISALAVLVLMEAFLLDGKLVMSKFNLVGKKMLKHIGSWWEKEGSEA